LAIAQAQDQSTLALRLAYTLRALGADESRLPRVTAVNRAAASAAVLLAAARAARIIEPEFALETAEQAITRSAGEVGTAEAWQLVAELRTTLANVVGAIEAWQHLAEFFPASAEAKWARLREGDLQRERGAFNDAIAAYREVLKVRQWRGPPWAEANYKIGLTHFEAGDFKAAFGFCQRVYVLYGGVAEWAAEAYFTSGRALEELNRREEAEATYRELIGSDKLNTQPAAARAAARLTALEGAS
jgi:tetratricopeptide (TPR) repeat protein